MRRDDRDVKEEIRARIDLVSVVSDVVALKRAGNTWKGLCPFHQEKSPSFTVSPERGLYKCFGCGESGDLFSFLMKTQNLTFGEALRELARRAGVTLEADRGPGASLRDAILDLNTRAAKYYANELASKRGEAARAYLAKRGLGPAECEAFGLGLAPASWDAFLLALSPRPSKELLEACGLFRKNDRGGFYDAFRDRIIFPIHDATGRVIAFGARSWKTDEQGPKYINSPETPVYVKGRHVYGLHRAKDAIKRQNQAVLVEGYTDVIIAHKHGFTNVVAALGTALTLEQVTSLSRLASEIVLAYDPDAAGQKAAERGIDIALDRGFAVRIAVLPGDADPADALERDGAAVFGKAIADARDFLEHRMSAALGHARTATDRARAARELAQSLDGVTDALVKATLLKTIADRFGVPEDALRTAVATGRPSGPGGRSGDVSGRHEGRETRTAGGSQGPAVGPGTPREPGAAGAHAEPAAGEEGDAATPVRKVLKGMDAELHLLRLMLDDASVRARAATELEPGDFSKPVRGEVFTAIAAAAAAGEPLVGDLGGRVSSLGLQLLAHIVTATPAGGDPAVLYADYRQLLTLRRLDNEINDCTVRLREPELAPAARLQTMQRLSALVQAKSRAVHGNAEKEGPR